MKNFKTVVIIAIVLIVAGAIIYSNNSNPEVDNNNENTNELINIDGIVLENLTDQEQDLLQEVKEKLKQNPEDVESLVSLARLQKYNDDSEDALETLKIAENIEPDNIIVLNNQMDILFNIKRYDESEEVCLKLLEKNSQWMNSYLILRDIYKYHKKDVYKTNKFPDLVKEGMEVDFTGVNRLNYLSMLANYYKDVKDKENALEWFEKYREADPENAEILKQIEEIKNW